MAQVKVVPIDKDRKEKAQRFFNAQVRSAQLTDEMIETVCAVSLNSSEQADVAILVADISAAQSKLANHLDHILPKRTAEQADEDWKTVKRGGQAENRICEHKHYTFRTHGRFCDCGTLMMDPGD